MQFAPVAEVRMGEIQKETLLGFWKGVVQKTGLKIEFKERMEHNEPQANTFVVTTSRGRHPTRSALLVIGRRCTPRRLGVPGEKRPKLAYRLVDAAQHRGQAVQVAGGSESALETAVAPCEGPGTTATLSACSAAFGRGLGKNRQRLQTEVGPRHLPNRAVIVCAGGELPTPLLQRVGVAFATEHGTA